MASNEPELPTSQEASTENTSTSSYRTKSDPAWAHCKQVVAENGRTVLLCLSCMKQIKGGGITRFKAHLAGVKGQVEKCKKVPTNIQHQVQKSIDEIKSKKRKVEDEFEDGNPCDKVTDLLHTQSIETPHTSISQKGKGRIGSYFMPRTTPGAQPTLKSVMQSKEVIEKCDLAIAKWMIDASVPFNATNSAYYQPMIDALCSMGPGYKGLNYYRIRGHLVNKWVEDVKILVNDYRSIWKRTGCTLMADGWTDRSRRTLINFLVYCPKGTVFIKSVDASYASKTADLLFKLFKEVVMYVGPENIVHIVTDNAANYVAAGRLLEKEFPHLFWFPCAAHCVNLMFQDIGKLPEVTDTVSHAANITKYLYNHCHPLYLMRQFTNGKEILRPAPTRFATNFIALQSILAQKDALRALVTSREWTSSAYSKDVKAKKCVEQVLDSNFWKQCADIVKITEPLVRVLRIVDSEDKPAMGFLYQAFFKARHEMERRFQRNKTKIKPYLEIMDSRWDLQLKRNLHAAGYWLNPQCFFNVEEFEKHKFTTSGLLDVFEKHAHGDPDLLDKLTSEMRIYKDTEFDFGRPAAIRERSKVMPDQWWETYGCRTPNLQKLAVRVLSQTCSASGCERNWSVFEHIHTNKRNRLEHQKLNNLVFVRYNLRLQQRSHLRHQNYDPINLEIFEDHSHFILEESPPFLTVEEIEALRNDLANISIQPSLDDNDQLNLDDDDDDAQLNPMENVNLDEDNVGQASGSNDEEIEPRYETTLTPWC
ncbi:hypothetical protein Lal_00009311 [Lupinus albus]|nr:hypothetical protein Lal_00009311 [Lupinus albus]